MGKHVMHKGVCINCGCDAYAIDYFGWPCSGRSVAHEYRNGICANCGFSRQVVEHFDWPCRIDPARAKGTPQGRPSETGRRARNDDHAGRRRMDDEDASWLHQPRPGDDEVRYGHLLGLKGKVTRGEIKFAYRAQANRYHPDRVAHLGPEFMELANERMKEINKAFAYFQKKYGL